MKHIFSLLILSFVFNISYGQGKKTETITIKTKISCSHCLQCGSCGANISDAIKEEKGIKKVTISPEDNTITVSYKTGKTTPEEIRTAISNVGYDADDIKAVPTAYAKLDGCCKKK